MRKPKMLLKFSGTVIGYDDIDPDTFSMLRSAGSVASVGTTVADQLQVTSATTSSTTSPITYYRN